MTLKSAAAYIRVSDSRQDEYSPESQLKLIKEYAERNLYVIDDSNVFYDDGISAKSALKRDAFLSMIEKASSPKKPFDAVLVWKFSRFARNQEESIIYKSILRRKNIDVISISEPSLDGPFGSFVERTIEWFDEYYLTRLSGEVKRGINEKHARGEPTNPAPFGYVNTGKHFSPSEDSEAVRNIFSSYVSGESIRHIATRLAASGVRTKKGLPIDARGVRYILSNPVYIGKIRYEENGQEKIVTAHHTPIIESDLWEKASRLLSYERGSTCHYSKGKNWILKGICRCFYCGATLTRSGDDRVQCHRYSKGSCTHSQSFSQREIISHVFSLVKKELSPLRLKINIKSPENSKESLSLSIKAEERRIQRYRDAYYNGVETLSEYIRARQEGEARIAHIKSSMSSAPYELRADIELLTFLASDKISDTEKNVLLSSFIEKITVDRREKILSVYIFT